MRINLVTFLYEIKAQTMQFHVHTFYFSVIMYVETFEKERSQQSNAK